MTAAADARGRAGSQHPIPVALEKNSRAAMLVVHRKTTSGAERQTNNQSLANDHFIVGIEKSARTLSGSGQRCVTVLSRV